MEIIAINLPNSFTLKRILKIERIPDIRNTRFWFLCKSDGQRTTVAAFFFFFLIHFPRPFSIRLFSCLNEWPCVDVCETSGSCRDTLQYVPCTNVGFGLSTHFTIFQKGLASSPACTVQTDRSTNDVNFFSLSKSYLRMTNIRI